MSGGFLEVIGAYDTPAGFLEVVGAYDTPAPALVYYY